MSIRESPSGIVMLMTAFNLEISVLPDDLKCVECKSVLKDACQVPCGCRFCRTCIDQVVARGGQFCPGGAQECGETPLSTAQRDFTANKSILKLTAKCAHAGCTHECPLADMEQHLRVCSRNSAGCPFREWGCRHGGLTDADMSSHMQQASSSHSEILIGLVVDINKDLEKLKSEQMVKDEQARHLENEIKSIKDENKSMRDEINSIKIENKSIDEEIQSIKTRSNLIGREYIIVPQREREAPLELVPRLAENPERESNKRASAGISVVASNRDALGIEMEPATGDIQSIKDEINSIKCRMESMQVALGVAQLDDWVIDVDLGKTDWGYGTANEIKWSGKFRGGGRPHTYELLSCNYVSSSVLCIQFLIWAGPSDALLEWPFRGVLTVTVANRDDADKCVRASLQCEIERPPDNQYKGSKTIRLKHVVLRGVGLDLKRGVRVSCQIVPGAGQ